MGKILGSKCQNCSYSETNLFLGSGKKSGCFFPFYDFENKKVESLNISDCLDLRNNNSELFLNNDEINRFIKKGLVPYFLNRMYKKKIFGIKKISPIPLYLQNKYNYCPKCERFALTFIDNGGLFD